MDCPNCGAYNASSSVRCRRCDHVLPADDGEQTSGQEWGPASGPEERWEESQDQPEAAEPNPWAWSEPEQKEQPEWSSTEPEQPAYADPLPSREPTSEYSGYGQSPDIPNYLWPAIGVTICCCAPVGIPAIVYASRVDAFLRSNDRAAAEEASSKAKTWIIAAVGASVLGWIAFFSLGFLGGGAG